MLVEMQQKVLQICKKPFGIACAKNSDVLRAVKTTKLSLTCLACGASTLYLALEFLHTIRCDDSLLVLSWAKTKSDENET